MIGSLTGTITSRLDQRILVEVNGIGYWVHTGSWQPEGQVTVYIHHHIREDAQNLYGFGDILTLALFERLLTVSGVGPKAALAVLSLGSVDRVETAIKTGEASFLSLAPGVGSKAAQKIILELRGKLPDHTDAPTAAHNDITSALESLGYKSSDLTPYLKKLPSNIDGLDAQIRWVLQQLAR